MIHRLSFAFLLPVLLAMLAPVAATAKSDDHAPALQAFKDGQAVTLQPESAYVLFRLDIGEGAQRVRLATFADYDFILVRSEALKGDPNAEAEDQVNVFRTDAHAAYEKTADAKTYLQALPPGRYVIAAVSFPRMGAGTCMCMGSVEFEAKPGVVTDLGYLLAGVEDRPIRIPELAAFGDKATKYGVGGWMLAATVRPASSETPVPVTLRALPIRPADYRAVGKFPNYFHTVINRMAPIPGVLAYDGETAVDLKAQKQ